MGNLDYTGYLEWKNWSSAEFGLCSREDALYYACECAQSGLYDTRGVKVLEIGFGNGSFAGWVSGKGAKYFGLEAIHDLVDIGRTQGYLTYDSDTPLSEITEAGSVDLVVAFDIFEHLELEVLISILRDIYDSMKNGAVLLLRVPSGDSPFSRAIQHGDLTHRLVLGSSAARQLAVSAGFEVISVRPPALPLWGLGISSFLRRSLVAGLRCIIYSLISNVLMDGKKPVLSPNMVCVFRKA